jgi:DNA polymerase III alpha subunit
MFGKFEKYSSENFGMVRLPEINITSEQRKAIGVSDTATHRVILEKLIANGFGSQRGKEIPQKKIQEYIDRAKFELDLIDELGFLDYFLLVWLVINKMRELDAFVDFGRGSCGASLIFWLLGITGVDPIEKELLFARFISRVRAKKKVINGVTYLQGDLAPDVDINLGGVRPEIVEWLKTLYTGKICRISTFSTLTGKMLIKDVFKVYEEAAEEEAKEAADLVEKNSGKVADIEDMPENSKKFKAWSDAHPETFKIALQLRNLIRQKSCHASGYVISYYDLDGFIPTEMNRDGELTSSYDMVDVSNLAIKLDLLGLTSNEIINDVLKNIPEKVHEINLDNDPMIYDQFQNNTLLPYGLYQISADCAYRVVNKIKPKNVYELSDVNAIARPGALDYLEGYCDGDQELPPEVFRDILKPTRNFCLYQEQMMQMAIAIGFSSDEAEILRKIVGKKLDDKVKEWKEKVYEQCEKSKLPKNVGDILWKILEDSANYSFNKAHSVSTSYLSALTVYLKYKHPLQFYLACLRATKHLPDPTGEIAIIERELPYFDIKLLPPNLMKSGMDFEIDGNNIRFGLSHLKGIAEKAVEKLIKFRKPYSNKFEVFKAADEAELNIQVLAALIMSGCLDEIHGGQRPRFLAEAYLWNLFTDNEKNHAFTFGQEFNYDTIALIKGLLTKLNEKGKPYIKETRYATIKKKFEPYWKIYNHNKKNDKLARYVFERNVLGYAYSSDLKNVFQAYCNDLVTIQEIKESLQDNDYIHVAAEVMDVTEGIAKNEKKTRYVKMSIKDNTGNMSAMLFNQSIDRHVEDNGVMVKKGDIVIIRGSKFKDAISCKTASINDTNIFLKISQMKQKEDKNENKIDNNKVTTTVN